MRKRTKPYDLDFRNRAVELVEQGKSCYAVAKLLGCYRTSVSNWVDRKRAHGHLRPKKKGHRPRKLGTEGQRTLRELVADRPDRTLAELRDLLAERDFEVSASTVFRELGKLGLALKKSHYKPRSATARTS